MLQTVIRINMSRNRIISYNPKLKPIARALRRETTKSEKTLWMLLRKKQLGYEFHRQVPIDNFIVDFYCHELSLVIEVDGPTHDLPETQKEDRIRQTTLEALGVRFLRFKDEDILGNPEKVSKGIEIWLKEN
jgi:very-short-patch-repair endonuclease